MDKSVTEERQRVIGHAVEHYPELLLNTEWRRRIGIVSQDVLKMDLMKQGVLLSNTKFEYFETRPISVQSGRVVYATVDGLHIIKRFQLQDDSHIRHFLRQSVLLRKLLSCSYLISITGVFLQNDYGYIIMPFYKHGNLKEYLAAAEVGVDTRRKLLVDVLHGLVFLHGQGHVHGDLKPENVFISKNNHAVIGDFDGARPMDTTISRLVATPKYLSPELRDGIHITTAADIYSLRCDHQRYFIR